MMNDFINTQFPQSKITVEHVDGDSATIRHKITVAELRPGGTVAGPVMFLVANCALYVGMVQPGIARGRGGSGRLPGLQPGIHLVIAE